MDQNPPNIFTLPSVNAFPKIDQNPPNIYTLALADLPVGYRFVPKDEDLITHYLTRKVNSHAMPYEVIQEIAADDFYGKPPRSLVPIIVEEREWYFFIHEDGKLPWHENAIRMVSDGKGFWKSILGGYPIYNEDDEDHERVIAFKIDFTYFRLRHGSRPKKTHWNMNLYRLPTECNNPIQESRWVVAKIVRGKGHDRSF